MDGLVEPIPKNPLALIVSADIEEVAKVEGDEVAMYRLLLMERNVHLLLVSDESPSASCGSVAFETCNGHCGVVVPMPTYPLVARKSEEVAVRVLVPLKYGNWPVVPE